jgi:hypothetical protein
VRIDKGVVCKLTPERVAEIVGGEDIVAMRCTTADKLYYATSEWGRDRSVVWSVEMERGGRIIDDATGMVTGAGGEGLVTRGASAPVPEPNSEGSNNLDPASIAVSDAGVQCRMTPDQVYAVRPDGGLRELRCSTLDRFFEMFDSAKGEVNRRPVWRMSFEGYSLLIDDGTGEIIGGGGRAWPFPHSTPSPGSQPVRTQP